MTQEQAINSVSELESKTGGVDMKYTVMINYDEYAVGIYGTKHEAEKMVVEYIRSDDPYLVRISDQELLDSNEGYYRVLEIKETIA